MRFTTLTLILALVVLTAPFAARADLCSKDEKDPFYIRITPVEKERYKLQICPFNGESCYPVGTQYTYSLEELERRASIENDKAVFVALSYLGAFRAARVVSNGVYAAYTQSATWIKYGQTAEKVLRGGVQAARTLGPRVGLIAGGVASSSVASSELSFNPLYHRSNAGLVNEVVRSRSMGCRALVEGSTWAFKSKLEAVLARISEQAMTTSLRKGIEAGLYSASVLQKSGRATAGN